MGAYKNNINSMQKASPDSLSPSFIRQLRNFMNNWLVVGGQFSFDGYRVMLRVAPGPSYVPQFSVSIAADSAGGHPQVNITSGYYAYVDTDPAGVPDGELVITNIAQSVLELTSILSTATSGTRMIYLRVPVESGAFATTYQELFLDGTPDFVEFDGLISDTFDFGLLGVSASSGYLYKPIAKFLKTGATTSEIRQFAYGPLEIDDLGVYYVTTRAYEGTGDVAYSGVSPKSGESGTGIILNEQTRTAYNDTGDEILYGYYVKRIINPKGAIKHISGETQYIIDEPEL